MKKIIWQPSEFSADSYDFVVSLDGDFARDIIQIKISDEKQKRVNELGNEELKKAGINWLNPYTLYEQSGFVSQIYLGNNGVWLATSHNNIESLLKKSNSRDIEYHSHNVDTPKEAHVLMLLFNKWIELSEFF